MTLYIARLRNRRTLVHILLLLCLVGASPAIAVSTCVSNSNELVVALALGQIQTQPYTIKIVQGTYLTGQNLSYQFSAPISIEGGYTANCAAQTINASNTVVDIGLGHIFDWRQDQGVPLARITVVGLTFSNSDQGVFFQAGKLNSISNDEGSILFDRVRFTRIFKDTSISPFYESLNARAFNGSITLVNVLIDHVSTTGACGVLLESVGGATVSINHMTADLQDGSDFCMNDDHTNADMTIYNSILWHSFGGLTIFRGEFNTGSTHTFINDIFQGETFPGPSGIHNQINLNPLWVNPSGGDYHLQNASPAVNSGTLFSPGGEPATDIEGKARIIGSAPDRGAYESLLSDLGTVLVTNTLDSGPGSLRDAINVANSLAPPAKVITFNIPGPCPAVIGLTSLLPTINGRMIIDGHTQPGSTRNTSATGFNANLCVVLKPASGSLNYAFTVPANSFGSLVLRGLGIGGFSQPVRILGGQNSQLVGNQFGGTVGGVALPGASFSAITFASSASGDILVGGNALGDRNLIGGAAQNGIDSQTNATTSFTTCSIVNNLIGMDRDGHSQLANTFGINVSGSGCQIVGNRIAGNTITNLWINNGSSNIVQQNLIGFNNQDQGFFNNSTGILVTGSNNVIGAGGNGGSITANTVRHNIAGGVVIKGDSASGNSVNANRIHDNGASNNGMDIDLLPTGGTAGPTPNDYPFDNDSGPNQLQNFPVPKSLVYTGPDGVDGRPGNLTFLLDGAPGSYRVDLYFSNAINSSGRRGHAETILAHTFVTVPASGRLSFTLPILVPNQSTGGVISMTATAADGSTSEVGTALSTDSIFADGIE
jgi:trimeric autotransporter adhesin